MQQQQVDPARHAAAAGVMTSRARQLRTPRLACAFALRSALRRARCYLRFGEAVGRQTGATSWRRADALDMHEGNIVSTQQLHTMRKTQTNYEEL